MKMLKLNYRPTKWNSSTQVVCSNEETILINPALIAAIRPMSLIGEDGKREDNLYLLITQIAYGRGINGVDFERFYLTEASYKKLMENIEIM